MAVRHVFGEVVERWNLKSGIRNVQFESLFLFLFVENHFAFTIFFVSLFNINIYIVYFLHKANKTEFLQFH